MTLKGHWMVTEMYLPFSRLNGDWKVTEWRLSVFTEWWRFVLCYISTLNNTLCCIYPQMFPYVTVFCQTHFRDKNVNKRKKTEASTFNLTKWIHFTVNIINWHWKLNLTKWNNYQLLIDSIYNYISMLLLRFHPPHGRYQCNITKYAT